MNQSERKQAFDEIFGKQNSSPMPFEKYIDFNDRFDFNKSLNSESSSGYFGSSDGKTGVRNWPSKQIKFAPRFCAVDLRDGNQALINPMNTGQKLQLWNTLVEIGFKEIEISFPSASETDYEFTRFLIENNLIPDDVTIQVLTQAREHLIKKTFESLKGCKRAIVHLYNSTSALQREVVFKMSKDEIKNLAVEGAKLCKSFEYLAEGTDIFYEYSPESFTGTEPDFAVEISDAVIEILSRNVDNSAGTNNVPNADPSASQNVANPNSGTKPVILNLPATVEMSTPNIFADMVEYVSENLADRDNVVLSIHPHNDQGMAVAAAHLGLLAGADRIEGCLFGNGERTGNVDTMTIAMNLFSQGIDPELDFSKLDNIKQVAESVTEIDISPRHPYAGDLVFTAFSGSHQDAIKKGMEVREQKFTSDIDSGKYSGPLASYPWDIPYIPIDPLDIGATYESVIRVNSQSGKGGIAYILKTNYKLDVPKNLAIEFSKVIQKFTDSAGTELKPQDIWTNFADEYLPVADIAESKNGLSISENGSLEGLQEWGHYKLISTNVQTKSDGDVTTLVASIEIDGTQTEITGNGNGPIDAFIDALNTLGENVKILDYTEHALGTGENANAASYVQCSFPGANAGEGEVLWGVGIDSSITSATIKAIISATNRRRK